MSTITSTLAHLRDILILPFTVTFVVPYFIYDKHNLFPRNISLQILAAILIVAGLILFLYTVFLFGTIGKGTLAPWSEKQNLVVAGPYRYCRNPMITGVFFILVGEMLFLHSISIMLWAMTFFIVNTVYFILSEEPMLEKRFGEQYRLYKLHVPRWIPALRPYKP